MDEYYLRRDLEYAIRRGEIDTLKGLLPSGSASNDKYLSELLRLACSEGQLAIVKHLLGIGANPAETDSRGFNAAHCATNDDASEKDMSTDIIQLLFEHNPAVINAIASDGATTCLHLAALNSDSRLITWLLNAEVDASVQCNGYTAWDYINRSLQNKLPEFVRRAVDSWCAFLQKECEGRRDDFLWLDQTKIPDLIIYELAPAKRMDLFALIAHMLQKSEFVQARKQIYRDISLSVQTSNGYRFREPSCVFTSHDHGTPESHEVNSSGLNVTKRLSSLEGIAPLCSPVESEVDLKKPQGPSSTSSRVSNGDSKPLSTDDKPENGLAGNLLSIVIPRMAMMSDDILSDFDELRGCIDPRDAVDSRFALDHQFKYCVSGQQVGFDYRGILTLDEYCYPALPREVLERRNDDQVISRFDTNGEKNRIMVYQVWIWQVQEALICVTLGDRSPLYKSPSRSVYGQIGAMLAQIIDDNDYRILDRFQVSIAIVAERVGEYLQRLGVESIGIDDEKQFYHDIQDIREEISMVQRIFSQQEEVWKTFVASAWPDIWAEYSDGGPHLTTTPLTDAQKEDRREISKLITRVRNVLQKCLRRIAQLDEDAERVERSIGIQLDLKQKHASLTEAHATAVMSAAVFGFTVITIIFTPLSFVLSLFALPIDRFQMSQVPSRWADDAGMYSTRYIGTWVATTEIVSVTLTILATWLALEYGLKYHVSKKTLGFMKTLPTSVKITSKQVQKTVKSKLARKRPDPDAEKAATPSLLSSGSLVMSNFASPVRRSTSSVTGPVRRSTSDSAGSERRAKTSTGNSEKGAPATSTIPEKRMVEEV